MSMTNSELIVAHEKAALMLTLNQYTHLRHDLEKHLMSVKQQIRHINDRLIELG